MKELLYLKDEQIKDFIRLIFYSYKEIFSDPKEILSKKFVPYRLLTISLSLSLPISSPIFTDAKTKIVSEDILSLPDIVIFLIISVKNISFSQKIHVQYHF